MATKHPAPSALRQNQRLRTRKELLQAAARLAKKGGRPPTLDEVAAEALVSRATAYRYFPSADSLLAEAPLDNDVPRPEDLFVDITNTDVEERVDLAEAALHKMVYANRAKLKAMLAASLRADRARKRTDATPVRQNRRLPLIEAALAPARARFDNATYTKLCAALSLIFGTESMVVLTDVHPTSAEEARRVKSWIVRTLVRAALDTAPKHKTQQKP
jgi:AcrR family transcriptional regulator